jgi:hypothetical protein
VAVGTASAAWAGDGAGGGVAGMGDGSGTTASLADVELAEAFDAATAASGETGLAVT